MRRGVDGRYIHPRFKLNLFNGVANFTVNNQHLAGSSIGAGVGVVRFGEGGEGVYGTREYNTAKCAVPLPGTRRRRRVAAKERANNSFCLITVAQRPDERTDSD